MDKTFRGWVVSAPEDATGRPDRRRASMNLESLPIRSPADDEVEVQVRFSGLNYKDALAASAHPGVARQLPIVPGIDAVGEVLHCPSGNHSVGDPVILMDARLGTAADGGFAERVYVPESWALPLPTGLTLRQAAIWGTAGFTAAQSVQQIQQHGLSPSAGPVLVTGSTGGVGVFAVKLLAHLGYEVIAVTGKQDRHDWLRQLGAAQVWSRDEVPADDQTPLLKGTLAAVVDTVGGRPLANLLKSVQPGGCVTACGLVAGQDLVTTVYPFILRGITLYGIDSANLRPETRIEVWQKIAGSWALEGLEAISTPISLEGLPKAIEQILQGGVCGRMLVDTSLTGA